jgi:hypothetical protein
MYLHNVWKKEERKEMILAAHLEPRPKTTIKQKTRRPTTRTASASRIDAGTLNALQASSTFIFKTRGCC